MLRKPTYHRGKSWKAHTDDLLGFASSAATLARDISNISACPPAAAAAAVVLLILETIHKVKFNQDACARLARRCAKILLDVDLQMTGRWHSAPPSLIKNLEKYRDTLWSIHQYMTLQMDVSWRMRFAKKGTIEDSLADLDALLNDASAGFQMSTLIEIHHAVTVGQKKTSKEVETALGAVGDGGSLGDSSTAEPATLFSYNPKYCFSLREQPEYFYHCYVEENANSPRWDKHFRQYRLSDVRSHATGTSMEGRGWWEGVTEADITSGKVVLVKRYDKDKLVQRQDWLKDVELLSRLYHPNFPQLLGVSLKNSPVPFILLGCVDLRSPQEAIVDSLRDKALTESSKLVLHFFHQLQNVTIYLEETFRLSPMRIQNFIDDASIGINQDDSIMVSLPEPSIGQIASLRNHATLATLRTVCLNMIPRTFGRQNTVEEDGKLLRDLIGSVHKLIRTHHIARVNGEYISPESVDEECSCASNIQYTPMWKGFSAYKNAEAMAVWDIGFIPKGKGVESFVRLGNVVKDELAAYTEDEVVSGVRWTAGQQHNLPYMGLPQRISCWTIDMPQNGRLRGEVTHIANASNEDAWQFLSQSGETLAQVFDIPQQDLCIITSVEHKVEFDISHYGDTGEWDAPPITMYLLSTIAWDYAPYLSQSPTRVPFGKPPPNLSPEWTLTIKLKIGQVQSVSFIGSEAPAVLSSSPTPGGEG